MVLNFSQDCKQNKKIKFLLFLNIKSNFIYINILHCYCVNSVKCIILLKSEYLNVPLFIELAVEFNLLKSTNELAL